MKQAWVALAVLAAVGGCSKGGTTASTDEFDKRWAEVSKAITDTFYIEDDRAAGLMGNITRSPHVPDTAQPTPGGAARPHSPRATCRFAHSLGFCSCGRNPPLGREGRS